MNTGLNEHARQKIEKSLNRFLADTYALYLKTQNFHWNVTGSDFFSLHLMFEKQYNELNDAIDEIAERIRALGFHVEGSFSAFKKLTSIVEEPKVSNAQKMLEHLLTGHELLIRNARDLAKIAENENDQATVDLMARRLNGHEKIAWMLRSHL